MYANGFVRAAVEQFLREKPDCRVRLSTPRGRARIEGVAGGQFDFAMVTDSPTTIRRVARREMYIEPLFDDHFILAANPRAKSDWGAQWKALSEDKPVVASELLGFPFILPESDASRREQFDDWCYRATEKTLNVTLEVGGWQTILEFVESGLGVGLVPQSAVELFQERSRRKLSVRPLDQADFPPDAVRLIARKAHGKDEPDLSDLGKTVAALVKAEIQRAESSAGSHKRRD
jgi:DNA-binding transcriptional LysR family regulator